MGVMCEENALAFRFVLVRKETSMIDHPSSLVSAFARHRRTIGQTAADTSNEQTSRLPRPIGPIGTSARLIVGLLLIGLIVYGQLVATKHFTPAAWALGLLGFLYSC